MREYTLSKETWEAAKNVKRTTHYPPRELHQAQVEIKCLQAVISELSAQVEDTTFAWHKGYYAGYVDGESGFVSRGKVTGDGVRQV